LKGKQDRHFGGLVVEFANAPTPETAGAVFIRGVAKAFGSEPGFLDNAVGQYLTPALFKDSLSPDDKELVELLLEERRLLSVINNLPCNISVASYDYDGSRVLTFKIQPLEPKWDHENPYEEDVFRVPVAEQGKAWLEDIAEMFDERAPLTTEMDEVRERLLSGVEEYIELGERILAVRSSLPPDKVHGAQKMAAFYSRIQAEQEVLAELVERWKMILEEVITTKNLSQSQALFDLLLVYNAVNRRETAVSDEGVVYEKPLFEESYFTERAGLADEYYHNVLACAFVEFLKVAGNRERLRRCSSCGSFFMVGSRREESMRCGGCSKRAGRRPLT
jgi:hypothetical protein